MKGALDCIINIGGPKIIMNGKNEKQVPSSEKMREIKIKNSPAAEALKKAPDEAIAKAIHDALLRQKEGK